MDIQIRQGSLFDNLAEDIIKPVLPLPDVGSIVGLKYIRDFIDQKKHDDLLRKIDLEPWLSDLKRRVQHYGYKYDYKSRHVDYTMRLGPLPGWAEEIAEVLFERQLGARTTRSGHRERVRAWSRDRQPHRLPTVFHGYHYFSQLGFVMRHELHPRAITPSDSASTGTAKSSCPPGRSSISLDARHPGPAKGSI